MNPSLVQSTQSARRDWNALATSNEERATTSNARRATSNDKTSTDERTRGRLLYNPAPVKPGRTQLEDVLSSLADPSLRYADIRYTATHQQHVKVRNGEVDHLSSTVDRAIGVRVLVGDGWGFAATSDISEAV